MSQAKAIAVTGIDRVEFVPIELPDLESGELLIRTEVSAVSRGTELRCMAGLQPGSVDFPFIPGYSLVGIVEAASADSAVSIGSRVFSTGTKRAGINLQWGGHVSHAIANASGAVPIPDGCCPKTASFAKMAAIALRGTRVAQPRPGDTVAVIGLGPIGMLSLKLYHAAGANVLGLDQEPIRVEIAKRAGLAAVVVTESIEQAVQSHFGHGADIVVDVTGVPAVLQASLRAAKDLPWGRDDVTGPKLVIQGSYPDTFSLPYQDAFRKELQILLPRDCRPGDLVDAAGLLADGTCKIDEFISWYGPPSDAAEAYRLLRTDRSFMTIAFDWSEYAS
jgi:2-desacetyl-2-hydroxyethyl bacteriochlorophyllide A dehydrogenase